ncbi:MAG: aspartate/ornithine carbamoyltransferase family protein, partial [Candidatus Nanopelagicaceae bacterium]
SQKWMNGSIINAGDGTHEHPTQALLDAYTIREHLRDSNGDLQDIRVAIVGDVLHSRVARSNVLLLQKLGASVTVIAPPTLLPVSVESWGVNVRYQFERDLSNFDAVMMLRVQRERMDDAFFPNEREYSRNFGLNLSRLNQLSAECIVMHPGPMNRGLEISADSADSDKAVIVDQVRNGVAIRMATLYLLLGGE